MPRSQTPLKRTPLRKKNPETAKVDRKIAPVKRDFKEEFKLCMRCGWRMFLDTLDVHEMLSGNNKRHKSKLYRECWLLLCRKCHEEIQSNVKVWPLARQLRLKLAIDPLWFDLDKIREVNGGGQLVTMQDIRDAEDAGYEVKF